jgi:hypothetical protein
MRLGLISNKLSGSKERKEGQEQDSPPSSSDNRTQARRAQIKKAQARHRQLKADYIQELESDIDRLNRNIESAEAERQALEQENIAMSQSISTISAAPPPETCTYTTMAESFTPFYSQDYLADISTYDQWSTQGFLQNSFDPTNTCNWDLTAPDYPPLADVNNFEDVIGSDEWTECVNYA